MARGISSFIKNCKGNVAIFSAFALIPVTIAAGSGIDILRQNDVNTKLQAAVDAAVLAAGAAKAKSKSAAEKIINDYIEANRGTDDLKSITNFKIEVDEDAGIYDVTVRGKINTGFMYLVGYPTMDVAAHSEVTVPYQGQEIALVLDNTGSMAFEGRLDALKSASKRLIDTVFSKKQNSTYVKIGIVPFSQYVNVGLSRGNEPWIDVPPNYQESVAGYCYKTYTWTNCRTMPTVTDGVSTTYQACDATDPQDVCVGPQTVKHEWHGCVGSRDNPLDETIGSVSNRYPGLIDQWCSTELTPLTDDQSLLNSRIDAMNADHNTYIPAGLLWGWNILDSNEPIKGAKTQAELSAIRGMKSLILMTDGDNTLSPGSGSDYKYHNGSDTAVADAKTAALCNNLKADGVNVYTVALKVSKQSSKDLLAACASSPSQAFDADDNAALQAAFDAIGNSLASLRLTK